MTNYCQRVIQCPLEVSETGYLFIWGDNTRCDGNPHDTYENWELKVVPCYQDGTQVDRSLSFNITVEELKEWGN